MKTTPEEETVPTQDDYTLRKFQTGEGILAHWNVSFAVNGRSLALPIFHTERRADDYIATTLARLERDGFKGRVIA